jgi:hypothetical protein
MAEGWTSQVAAAAGVAAATGAAQLGLGYGLGVVVWPAANTADDSIWLGSLGWATWITASSTIFGAIVASRFRPRAGGPWRFALAASAAVGALLAVALIALPARTAVRPDTFSAESIAGGYAALGVLLGLVVAYWAVVSRPVAANVVVTSAWLWALAAAGIVMELIGRQPAEPFLSGWPFADQGAGLRYGAIYWPSALLTLGATLIIGALGALPAVRRGELGIGAAASGAVGPLLVAAAFFVLAPQLTGALGALQSAYLIAPYAVLTGLAGSAATVALGRRIGVGTRRQPRVVASERRRARTATGTAAVPEQPSAAADPAPGQPQQRTAPPVARQRAAAQSQGDGRDRGNAARPAKPPSSDAEQPPSSTAAAKPPPSLATAKAPSGTPAKPPSSTAAAKPPASLPTAKAPAGTAAATPPTSTAAKADSRAPASGRRPAESPSTTAGDHRSTVAPPPAAPPVANINPTRSGDSTSGSSATPATDPVVPARSPAAKATNRGRAKTTRAAPAKTDNAEATSPEDPGPGAQP